MSNNYTVRMKKVEKKCLSVDFSNHKVEMIK